MLMGKLSGLCPCGPRRIPGVGAWVQPSHSEEKQWMYTPTMRMRG